jgi:hypothetical protein
MATIGPVPKEDDRVSLSDLDPEEALRALLKVDPSAEPVEDDPAPPHGDPLKSPKDSKPD